MQGNEQRCGKGRTWARKQAKKAKVWEMVATGKQKGEIKPMVCGETASMCKEGAGKREVTKEARPQERGALQNGNAQEIKRERAQGEGQRNGVRKQALRCGKGLSTRS